ncbi:hypothetical protein VPMS16_152 [Vibrio sp. 16]|nr:hypothetical protein VPMS16_152 [Vibrio sp. 16]
MLRVDDTLSSSVYGTSTIKRVFDANSKAERKYGIVFGQRQLLSNNPKKPA